jgi:hypothetical protein
VNDSLYFYDTSYEKAFDIYEFETFEHENNTYIFGMWVENKHSSLIENNYYNYYRAKETNEQSYYNVISVVGKVVKFCVINGPAIVKPCAFIFKTPI